jgi:hypothetical protein
MTLRKGHTLEHANPASQKRTSLGDAEAAIVVLEDAASLDEFAQAFIQAIATTPVLAELANGTTFFVVGDTWSFLPVNGDAVAARSVAERTGGRVLEAKREPARAPAPSGA